MNEKTKDSDKGAEDQRFSPTDWDWVMLLSGEINAIETSSHAFANMFIGTSGMAIVIIATLGGIAYSNFNSTNPSIIIYIIVLIIPAIIYFCFYSIKQEYSKRRHEDVERVKLLKKCRDEIFDRLDDSNSIVERCFKKGDENR